MVRGEIPRRGLYQMGLHETRNQGGSEGGDGMSESRNFLDELLAGLLDGDVPKPPVTKPRFNRKLMEALRKPMWLRLLENWEREPWEFVQ